MHRQVWTPDEVKAFVAEHGGNTSGYGKNGMKGFEDLARELNKPEVRLRFRKRDRKILREVRTLRMLIEAEDPATGEALVLEEHMKMPSLAGTDIFAVGKPKKRNFPFGASASETIPIGKTAKATAADLFRSELGIRDFPLWAIVPWLPPLYDEHESTVYPGITSAVRYQFMYAWFPRRFFRFMYVNKLEEDGTFSLFAWGSAAERRERLIQEERAKHAAIAQNVSPA